VELTAVLAVPAVIAPGSFAVRHYRLTLPDDAVGRLILELTAPPLPPARTVIEVVESADSLPARGDDKVVSLAGTAPATSAFARTFEDRLAVHEPIYFIYGRKAPAAKLQFSFKYRVLDLNGPESRNLRSLQFAYTQRSLWDVNASSSPFYDTSYMPELMFESVESMSATRSGGFNWLGYQTGIKHESNGRAGPTSRSLNTGYFRTVAAFGTSDGWYLILIPEAHAYIGGLGDNGNLKDYRGYGQLRAVLGYKDGPSLLYTGQAGKSLDHPTTQLDFTVPVRSRFLDLKIYALVQYFDGYGESLLHYDRHSQTVRAGVSLVR
jgi:outer membrane phospholipase A